MGSRGSYKSTYTRGASTTRRKDSLRAMIQGSRQNRNQQLRAVRPGYGSTPRTIGALPGGEMKYYDTERNVVGITTATTTWPVGTMLDPSFSINLGAVAVANPSGLFQPTVGPALNQRIGRKVAVHKIRIHGTLSTASQTAQALADAASKVRLCLVMDKQTNSASMTGAQLFTNTSTPENSIHSFQNPDNFGRFQLLKDKMIVMQNPSLAGTTPTIDQAGLKFQFKWTINFKNPILVNFNATNGGTIADVIDNSFHVVGATDVGTLAPALAYYCRFCYKE